MVPAQVGFAAGFGLRGATRGDIGLAQALEDLDVEAGTIVGDDDFDLACRPGRVNDHRGFGEIDRILDQVAESVEHFGTPAHGQRTLAFGGEVDLDAEAAVRLGNLVEQGAERQASGFDVVLGGVALRELAENYAAAVGLTAQQSDVVKPG